MNHRFFPSFNKSSRFFVVAAPLFALGPACATETTCSEDACGDAGAKSSGGGKSSGGAKASSGGRRSAAGGDESSGGRSGAKGSGGMGGSVPDSAGGSAGEESGAGGARMAQGPHVVAAEIDGQAVEVGETLRGVREKARIRVKFSHPMDTLSVEEAFVPSGAESALSSFIVGWNEENTELTLILRSSVRYEEVTSPEGSARELGFLLTTGAKDEEGQALSSEFFLSFSLLRRWTLFIEPDLSNTAVAYGNVPFDYVQKVDDQVVPTEYLGKIGPSGGNCPWLSPENEHDDYAEAEFRREFPYSAAKNFSSPPGRHGSTPRGTRVAIYSFPLADVPTGGLERATLKLAKWTRVRLDEKDKDGDGSITDYIPYYSNPPSLDDLPFSVDAMPSFTLPANITGYDAQLVFSKSSWRANLLNQHGEEYSKGVGYFQFDVKELIEDGLDAADPSAIYRADFDGLPVVKDDPITVCVTMGLETVALVE